MPRLGVYLFVTYGVATSDLDMMLPEKYVSMMHVFLEDLENAIEKAWVDIQFLEDDMSCASRTHVLIKTSR